MNKGIQQIGSDFGSGTCFLPELIGAADVMKAGVAILDERIKTRGKSRKSLGKIVIGTVKGDIHDIGKSVVAPFSRRTVMTWWTSVRCGGFKICQRGPGTDADCVAMSSLLTVTIQNMRAMIEELKEAGMRNKVKVIVGGAPVTQEFADAIGADAFGHDAADAVKKMKMLLGTK